MKFKNKNTGNIIVATQEFIDGRDDSSDWELVQEVIIPPTFEENQTAKIKELQDKYQAEYNAYLSKYPQAEVATFDDKKREAIAYNLDNTAPTPIIDNILVTLSNTKEEYVQSILNKINYLAQQEGAMVEKRGAIKACTTQAELDAITI